MTDGRLDGLADQGIRSVRAGDEVVVKCRAHRAMDPGWGNVVFEIAHLILLWRN